MSRLFFAAESGPHISLKAETLFTVSGVGITNSMLYGLLVMTFMIIGGVWLASKSRVQPSKGPVQLLEIGADFIVKMLEDILQSRAKAVQYAPIFGTFFFFIIFSNISGLMPVVGEGITVNGYPIFRPFTADLNGTIAMAVIAIFTVQILSIRESGVLGHLKHYFSDKPLNPINMFIGFLEVVGELTRIMSLSLRLFLNTAVGEILISVFVYLGGYGSSFTVLPIILFETLVAVIQAYVFTVLAATYLGLAIAHGHEEHDEHTDIAHSTDETIQPGTVPAGTVSGI